MSRLVLWNIIFIFELHFAETQAEISYDCAKHNLSALCFLAPFRLSVLPQDTVNVPLDNVVLLCLFFQLPIVRIKGFLLGLELFIFPLLQRQRLGACRRSAPLVMPLQPLHGGLLPVHGLPSSCPYSLPCGMRL